MYILRSIDLAVVFNIKSKCTKSLGKSPHRRFVNLLAANAFVHRVRWTDTLLSLGWYVSLGRHMSLKSFYLSRVGIWTPCHTWFLGQSKEPCMTLQHPLSSIIPVELLIRWRGSATGRALDLRSTGGLKSYSGQKLRNNLGQVVHTYVPLLPSSINWYRQRGSDALRLGR